MTLARRSLASLRLSVLLSGVGLFLGVSLLTHPGAAQAQGVVGDWREPGGSVIRIAPCGTDVCARLVAIAPGTRSQVDGYNPDPNRRHDRLCGLQIGYGFHPSSPDHAAGGHLYDPKSGKTYQGEFTAAGDRLFLRGYVGVKLFGRTEQWTRVAEPAGECR